MISFQIIGELTIRDISVDQSFEMQITIVSENRIEGYGSTVVLRSDYALDIPSVPSVASVSDEVLLEIIFAAER